MAAESKFPAAGCGAMVGIVAVVAVVWSLWPKPAPSRTGNPAVYARIDSATDCSALLREIDTAYETHQRLPYGHELRKNAMDYMTAAEARMKVLGCSAR